MSLYTRLLGLDTPRLPAHNFTAALAELQRGKMARAEVIAAFAITVAEEADLDVLIGKVGELPESYPLGAHVALANVGTSYDAIAASKGLGFVAVDVANVTRAEMRIRYNKVGTGTLTWQLWNETDATDLGTVDDAVGGDNKVGAIVVTPGSPLTAGVKLLRPRVKSTTGADAPVYYGACLMLRRVARLASPDLHEILMLAASRVPPYTTEAAVKARLGV